MAGAKKLQMLFTGYAPVHFACFRPLYERLAAQPGIEVTLSGGLRTKSDSGVSYDETSMYRQFNLPAERIASVAEIRDRDFDVVFGSNTNMIPPRRADVRVQIFHGLSFRNKAVRPDNMNWDHYFIVGPYMRRRFAEAGLLPCDDPRAVPIGFMKTDRLLHNIFDRSRLLAEYGLGGDRPILLYAPTGARDNSLETMGEPVIRSLAATGRYMLLIKPHDHPKNSDIDWFERLGRLEDEHCRVMREPDVIKLLYLADLLISDASSVANEFLLLDRPIVFLDTPDLIARAQAARNSMVDLDTWGRKGGVVVTDPGDVVAAVMRSLAHPRERSETRRAMAADFFYNPGHATDAAMAWLQEHLIGQRSPAAMIAG